MIKIELGLLNRQAWLLLLSLLLTLVISSCTPPPKSIEIKQPSRHEQQLEEQNRQLSGEVDRLQQELLGKQEEIKKLVLARQNSTREVVRTKAKLRSHSSKAGTVANIAEVKAVLKVAAERSMDDQLQQVVLEAEQVVAMSVDALTQGDVENAFNLSSRAQQLIQPIRALEVKNFLSNKSDIVFVAPLAMKVLTTCNVRTGPGTKNDVRFILREGTYIKALAYVKNWIQVESDQKGKGWIYYRLLEIVP
ncbi:MAG: SH3 domain-containing protein [Desulfocapsa sp.]|nr:SH3 domain-containing protein [Desulfocapsa sp.]